MPDQPFTLENALVSFLPDVFVDRHYFAHLFFLQFVYSDNRFVRFDIFQQAFVVCVEGLYLFLELFDCVCALGMS